MGIEKKTIEIVTCDICEDSCGKQDGDILITVSGGGRDIGATTINGSLRFNQPYGVSNGILCHNCKVKWLSHYLKGLIDK